MARQLVELGYRGSGDTLKRDEFEARKRALRERNAQRSMMNNNSSSSNNSSSGGAKGCDKQQQQQQVMVMMGRDHHLLVSEGETERFFWCLCIGIEEADVCLLMYV